MAQPLRVSVCLLIVVLSLVPWNASAQDQGTSPIGRAIKATLLDPTTYPPAMVTYDGTMRDWKTSQTFFRNGFVEQNPRFTLSGRSGDKAVSYEAGRNQILRDSLSVLAVSAAHNFSTQLIEQALRDRYPEHRKIVTALGWIERSAVASLMSYELAGPHYRQWRQNQRLIGELGIR